MKILKDFALSMTLLALVLIGYTALMLNHRSDSHAAVRTEASLKTEQMNSASSLSSLSGVELQPPAAPSKE